MSTPYPTPVLPAGRKGDGPRPARSRLARLVPYLAWEVVLLLLVLVAAALVATRHSVALSRPATLYTLAGLGLLAAGLDLSLRTATPNLAVAGLAALSGATYAVLLDADWSTLPAALAAVAVATLISLVLGLVTGVTSVPAWAVSLGGLAGTGALVLLLTEGRPVPVRDLGLPSTGGAVGWLLLFAVVTIGVGLAWQVPSVRRFLGGDPGVEWSARRLVGALVGFTGSGLLAGLSGLVVVAAMRAALPASGDLGRLTLALGVVLLAGVGAAGRRGGVAGTLLATALLTYATTFLALTGAPVWMSVGLLPAAAILVGLLVGWVLGLVAGPDPEQTGNRPVHGHGDPVPGAPGAAGDRPTVLG